MKNDASTGERRIGSPAFCECDPIDDPSSSLAQGDVFEWLQPSEDAWQRHGIVVTADCDIAHHKHSGILSYVPLLTAKDYIAAFYLPKQNAKILPRVDDEVVRLIHRLQSTNLPLYPSPVTREVAIGWVDQADGKSVADDLNATGPEREKLMAIVAARGKLIACQASPDIDAHISAICLAREVMQGVKANDSKTKIWKEVQSYLKELPGDALFIRSLTEQHTTGFVACLRFVRELKQSAVAIKAAALTSGAQARRIGRLRAPYVYRLTQMLGSVFSSIGLPDAYEASRHELTELLQVRATVLGNQ
jgi:hypothetical protein